MSGFITRDMLSMFFPEENTRNLYQTSQLVRSVISKEVLYYISLYIHFYELTQSSRQSLKIGIIGLGHLGCTILEELINLNILSKSQLMASTRTPEKHTKYQEQGIEVVWNNEKVAKESDILVLSCLPHQAEAVMSAVKGPILVKSQGIFDITAEHAPRTLILSVLAGVPISKISQMCDGYPLILRTRVDIEFLNSQVQDLPEEGVPVQIILERLSEHIAATEEDVKVICNVYSQCFYSDVDAHIRGKIDGNFEDFIERFNLLVSDLINCDN